MMIKAKSGIKVMRNYVTYFEIHNNGCEFFKDVTAPAYLTSSDARLKSNINVLGNNSSKLQMITPYRYILDNSAKQEEASISGTEKLTEKDPVAKPREQYGFLAQEVKKIFPNLVVEDENGWLSIDYIGFIPLLLNEVNRLQSKVESLEAILSEENQPKIKKIKDHTAIDIITESSLSQNKPNPFTGYTEISCVIPEECADAYLCIYDLQGKQIEKYVCIERGQVVESIDGTSLEAGMYIYALIIDGQEIDSKRMVVL